MTPEQEKALDSAMGKAGYSRREETARDSVAQPPVPRTTLDGLMRDVRRMAESPAGRRAIELAVTKQEAAEQSVPPLDVEALSTAYIDAQRFAGPSWHDLSDTDRMRLTAGEYARLVDGAQATPQPSERSEPARSEACDRPAGHCNVHGGRHILRAAQPSAPGRPMASGSDTGLREALNGIDRRAHRALLSEWYGSMREEMRVIAEQARAALAAQPSAEQPGEDRPTGSGKERT